MENELYALSLIALIAGATLLLVSGILLGMLIPRARRWRAKRQLIFTRGFSLISKIATRR